MATMTKEENAIHLVLVDYDKARKSEGYAVGYRRWAWFVDIGSGKHGKKFGEHVETLYLHPSGKSLLVKIQPDGGVSAFEAVA